MFTGSFSPEEAARNPVLPVGWRTRRIKESPFVVQFVRTKWHVEKRELPHAEHHYRTGDFTTCSTISFLALSQSNELRQPEQLELLHLREMRNLTYGPTVKAESLTHCFKNGSSGRIESVTPISSLLID